MVLRKTSDQYLAAKQHAKYQLDPSTWSRDIDFKKNFNQKLKHKISKSVTLTSRSPRVGHDGTA